MYVFTHSNLRTNTVRHTRAKPKTHNRVGDNTNKKIMTQLTASDIQPQGEVAFFLWLDSIRPIINAMGLCKEAGIPLNALNNHYAANSERGEKRRFKVYPLSNAHFAKVARAFMKASNAVVAIGHDRFQLGLDGRICAWVVTDRLNLVPLSDEEFNSLF